MSSPLQDFLLLFATIDPMGTLPLFLGVTASMTYRQRRNTAFKAFGYATAILLAFLVGGQVLFDSLGIRLVSFQLAGSTILFLFGLKMIFDTSTTSEGDKDNDVAVYPLAIPSIASPGAILAIVMLTENSTYSIAQQAMTSLSMFAVLIITLGFMLLAEPIYRVIGKSGCNILVRLSGIVLCSLATEMGLSALETITR